MKKSWNMIPKILSGEKTIESRWYSTKRMPWNAITVGDIVYFKNSGEAVIASATVLRVLQFEINHIIDAEIIIKKYGKKICLVNAEVSEWNPLPNYCILVFIEHPLPVKKPFTINKEGFGMPVAWLTVADIATIKK